MIYGYGCARPCYNPCQQICCPTQYACAPPLPCPCPCPCPCPSPPPAPPSNFVAFTAVDITSLTLAAGVPQAIPFALATTPSAAFSTVTGLFTAPVTGTYQFVVSLSWTTAVPNTTLTGNLTLNGVPSAVAGSSGVQPAAGAYVLTFVGDLTLTAGSVVGVSATASTAAVIVGAITPVTSFSGKGPK